MLVYQEVAGQGRGLATTLSDFKLRHCPPIRALDGKAAGVFCRDVVHPLKTLALEELYADPHKLDSYLESGETFALIRGGRAVAEFVPHPVGVGEVEKRPSIDYRARFVEMWGADAFDNGASVADEWAEIRRNRVL